jgi:hypothetical protein
MSRDSVKVLPKKVSWRRLIGRASRCTHLKYRQLVVRHISIHLPYSSSAEDGLHAGATAAAVARRFAIQGFNDRWGALRKPA